MPSEFTREDYEHAEQGADLVTVGAMHRYRTTDKLHTCVHCGAWPEDFSKPCKSWIQYAHANEAEIGKSMKGTP